MSGCEDMILANHFGRRMAVEIGWPEFPAFHGGQEGAQGSRMAWQRPRVEERRRAPSTAGAIRPCRSSDRLRSVRPPWRPRRSVSTSASMRRRSRCSPRLRRRREGSLVHFDMRAAVAEYERDILRRWAFRCRHNQRETAVALGLSYDQLRHCSSVAGMLVDRAAAPTPEPAE